MHVLLAWAECLYPFQCRTGTDDIEELLIESKEM